MPAYDILASITYASRNSSEVPVERMAQSPPCTDPGIMDGDPGPTARKQSFSNQRKLLFSKVSEGVQIFPGAVQMLLSIETHITCDFPGGVRTPYPPSGSPHVD